MPYAVQSDIEGEFKNVTFSASTLVSTTDISNFLTQADAFINSFVGMRYVVPVTADASALALLKMYAIVLVSDRIKKILEVKQVTNTAANQDVRGAFGTREVIAALNQIKKGELLLSGATALTVGGGFSSYTKTNSVAPLFEKETIQW